jgi:hypothetical protein
MVNTSIIVKSGQLWKGAVSAAMILLGGLCAALCFAFPRLGGSDSALVMNSGFLMVLCGMLYGTMSIRCPRCGTRWVSLAIRQSSATSWIEWLLTRSQCPVCNECFKSSRALDTDLPDH